jgi:hypothetical protein
MSNKLICICTHLASDCNLSAVLESDWTRRAIAIVEYYSYAGFGHACLATLVDQILETGRAHL